MRAVSLVRARTDEASLARMADEVRAGLLARPLPTLPSKYFYDARGGALFDEITRLPPYYLFRAEEALLERVADRVAQAVPAREVCELGSGLGRKTRLVLDAVARRGTLERCLLFDVSEEALAESAERLSREYPGLVVRLVVGDFEADLALLGAGGGRLAMLLGGTIGNLAPDAVPPFLRAVGRGLAPGDGFLVGVDLEKDPAVLEAAYDDPQGVTADFNRNVLRVVNARLDGDFDPEAFAHVAFYDRERRWVEMRLRAIRPMRVRVGRAGLDLRYETGDEIRTEISCKYTRHSFGERVQASGLSVRDWHEDPGRFALALLAPP